MAKLAQQDDIDLKVRERMTKAFAETVKLDYSEASLLVLDRLSFFVVFIGLKEMGLDPSERGFRQGFEALDRALVSAKTAGVDPARLPSSEKYQALKTFFRERHSLTMTSGLLLFAGYMGAVMAHNLGGEWTVRRPWFGSPKIGVEVKNKFFSEDDMLESIAKDFPSNFYRAAKAEVLGISVDAVQLLSAAPR